MSPHFIETAPFGAMCFIIGSVVGGTLLLMVFGGSS